MHIQAQQAIINRSPALPTMGAATSDLMFNSGDLPRVRYVQPSKDAAGNALTWNFVKKLRVSHESPENPIEFQQIEIYGVDGINYALKENGGTAVQSSDAYPPDAPWGHASCVIDGDRYGYFNCTACLPNGWLDVTLSEPRWIESFAIFNSGFDMCVKANDHLVQLLDQENLVVYEHRIAISEDLPLFDPNQLCALKFINEESKVVTLKLILASSAVATKVRLEIHDSADIFQIGSPFRFVLLVHSVTSSPRKSVLVRVIISEYLWKTIVVDVYDVFNQTALDHFLVIAALSQARTCWDCRFPLFFPTDDHPAAFLQVNVFASHSLSGRPLNPFDFSIAEPEAVQNLCQQIYAATGIATHQQRLLLEDGQILRMRSGTWEPQGSLHEICPSLLRSLSAEKTYQDGFGMIWAVDEVPKVAQLATQCYTYPGIQLVFFIAEFGNTDVWVIWIDLECLAEVIYVL